MDKPDIYNTILKTASQFWSEYFLKFCEIDVKRETISLNESQCFLDYLCKLKDGQILNIEVELPEVKKEDYPKIVERPKVANVKKQVGIRFIY